MDDPGVTVPAIAWTGRLYGLEVRSEIPLGRCRPGSTSGSSNLCIHAGDPRWSISDSGSGEVLAHWSTPDGMPFLSVVRGADGYRVTFHRRCVLDVSTSLDELTCHPNPGTSMAETVPYLVGTGLAAVLCLRDELVLHASAFTLRTSGGVSSAIGVLGESGSGKSTLTALACAAGAELLADDVLRIGELDGVPSGAAGLGEVRLRPDSAAVLRAAAVRPPERQVADGRFAVSFGMTSFDRVPLGGFLVPVRVRSLARPRLTRLLTPDALLALAKSPRVSGWRGRRYLELHFEGTRALAATVPVYRAELPADDATPLDTVRDLLELIGELVETHPHQDIAPGVLLRVPSGVKPGIGASQQIRPADG